MKQILIFSLLFFCCKQNIKSQANVQPSNSIKPTNRFFNFTNYLDSIGYIADTSRARKIAGREFDHSSVILVSNNPFFRINPSSHEILLTKEWLKGNSKFDTMNVDYEIFKKPKTIFAYYYRHNIEGDLIEDGVIEEWIFKTDNDAKKALNELDKIKDLLYFNTASFHFRQTTIFISFIQELLHLTLH